MEHASQRLPVAVGRHEVVGGVALDVLLDARQRLLGDGSAVRQRDPEDLEPERRLRGRALRSRKRTPSPAISKCRPTWRDTLMPDGGVAARRTRTSERDEARAWRK